MMIDDLCTNGHETSKSVNGSEERKKKKKEKKEPSPDCHCASIAAVIYQWYKKPVRRKLNRSHVGGFFLRSLKRKQCVLVARTRGMMDVEKGRMLLLALMNE